MFSLMKLHHPVWLIVIAVLLPIVVWFGGRAILSADPVPNQGGMVVVMLAFIASLVVSAILTIVGIVKLVRQR